MAPDVLLRKLTFIRQLLIDLSPYRGATLAEVEAEHYKLERLLELLVMTASDILHHLLAEQGAVPESYRDGFKIAGERGFIPVELSGNLQQAAGMRNILVHMYQDVDYAILRDSIDLALEDFSRFVKIMAERVEED